MTELSIGERMQAAFGGIDMTSALRLSFNKCPNCAEPLVRGAWLRYCADRTCEGHIGALNKELGKTIDYIKPQTVAETEQLQRLAEEMGIETRWVNA